MKDMDATQLDKIRSHPGFFAALDQSGGSTPKALAAYGVGDDAWSTEDQMFDLVHAMRTRVMTDSAFDGNRILAAILFEQTMERQVDGVPTSQYLWEVRQIVPFLKVDKGLAELQDDAQLMKPIDNLDETLEKAVANRIFGTKMRSVIADANPRSIEAIADQQFAYAARILAAGLVPILEPEVSITSATKADAETLLNTALRERLEALPGEQPLMFKLTIPAEPGLYADLAADPRVLRVLALSGGYPNDEACERLAKDPVMIASFSRGLLEDLRADQTDEEFHAALESAVESIYSASTAKKPIDLTELTSRPANVDLDRRSAPGSGRRPADLAHSGMGSQTSSATSMTRSDDCCPGSAGARTSPVHTQTTSFSRR